MSVRPVTFNPDGSIEVVFDELSHNGTIPAAEVLWSADPLSGDNHNYIVLNCPDGCGASSTHPVGGGAAPLEVQQMFVNKTERAGCACGQTAAGDTSAMPESHVRLNVNRMDGPGRWQLETPAQREQRENAPNIFQVVYRKSDRLIVGLEPKGGVGPDNSVGVIHDMAEYDVLMRTNPAYLGTDGDHIQGTPP
ncbi:MAG TPA: hypothetical protein VFB50_03410 [Chloroflexota bacterium]|nr:hypothetical protein [Chloroflexota bacterium]